MDWKRLCIIRGSHVAIQAYDGKIISILCGSELHNDLISKDNIEYIIPNRVHYKKSVTYFHKNLNEKIKIQVYLKEFVDCWSEMGNYIVENISETELNYIISLKSAK
jgi:hypothetical protein